MFPTQFSYHRPTSLDEAVRLVAADPDAKLLAGGHSLLPAMKLRLAAPETIVDLGRIEGLRGISTDGGGRVTIGAMTTYDQLIDSADLRERLPFVAEVAHHVGDAQVRSLGTLGGSLAHADPAADYTAVMLALGAEVTARGPNGERTIAADDFFVDILTTALEPDEILTAITIPVREGRVGMAYEKHEHPASGYPVVGVAAVLELGEGDTCRSARIAVTGCTPKATRAAAAEAALTGQPLTPETIAAAARAAPEGLDITGEVYASEEYRGHLVTVVGRRVLEEAASRARG